MSAGSIELSTPIDSESVRLSVKFPAVAPSVSFFERLSREGATVRNLPDITCSRSLTASGGKKVLSYAAKCPKSSISEIVLVPTRRAARWIIELIPTLAGKNALPRSAPENASPAVEKVIREFE